MIVSLRLARVNLLRKIAIANRRLTLVRVRKAAARPLDEIKVRTLGVDDWALKKGQHYGRILVDLEKRRPIDLLQGREAAPLEEWLKNHPEIEVITHDRAGAYAARLRVG
jgi:transposase